MDKREDNERENLREEQDRQMTGNPVQGQPGPGPVGPSYGPGQPQGGPYYGPGQSQPGPGQYGYRNPYQNNWQNRKYYGNDMGRMNAGGYNNYPNGNYGTGYGSYNRPPEDGDEKKKMSTGKKVLLAAGICALVFLCVGGILLALSPFDGKPGEEAEQVVAEPSDPQIAPVDLEGDGQTDGEPAPGMLMDVSDLVEKIMPSVVSVNAVYTYDDSYWGEEKYNGGGSGFIIGENETELLVVTNSHVVTDAEDLEVTFSDEFTADARVKGYDNDLDVAVIAVRLQDITEETKQQIAVAKLGDSTTLRAGQAVISIGNALMLGQSVTTGIISAVNAPVGGGYDDMGNQYGSDDRVMIQTTAFINPGCSGGVLVDTSGEVIGINTMTYSGVGVEGMCYAVPITDAIPVIDKLKVKEIRERLRESESGYLGITCSNVEGKQAKEYDIPNGVYIRTVEEDKAADEAGLRKGDVIVSLDGVPVETTNELSELLRYYAVNEIVDVEIMRYEEGEYQSRTVSVKLGKK